MKHLLLSLPTQPLCLLGRTCGAAAQELRCQGQTGNKTRTQPLGSGLDTEADLPKGALEALSATLFLAMWSSEGALEDAVERLYLLSFPFLSSFQFSMGWPR